MTAGQECAVGDFPPMVWSDGSLIEVGQLARCERLGRARGTWRRYAGKVGEVVQVVDTLTEGRRLVYVGEVGARLGGAVAWFRPWELENVPHTVHRAPRSLATARVGGRDPENGNGPDTDPACAGARAGVVSSVFLEDEQQSVRRLW